MRELVVRTSAERKGATGVAIVDKIVNGELRWLFRRQDHGGSDHGIDAQIEIVDGDEPTGRLLAIQIKAGPRYLRKRTARGFQVHVSARHLRYWLGHSLPVVFIVVDINTEIAYWQLVQEPIERTAKGANLYVPPHNRLVGDAATELRSFTQTPTELKAERYAAVQEARRLSAILAREKASQPRRVPPRNAIEGTESFWASLRLLPDTDDIKSSLEALTAAVSADPCDIPVINDTLIRLVRTRPYQGTPGLRLFYVVDDAVVKLLLVEMTDD